MSLIDKIKEKAKSDLKTVVLPEGEEERTIKAASVIAEQKLAKLVMLGDEEKIKGAL